MSPPCLTSHIVWALMVSVPFWCAFCRVPLLRALARALSRACARCVWVVYAHRVDWQSAGTRRGSLVGPHPNASAQIRRFDPNDERDEEGVRYITSRGIPAHCLPHHTHTHTLPPTCLLSYLPHVYLDTRVGGILTCLSHTCIGILTCLSRLPCRLHVTPHPHGSVSERSWCILWPCSVLSCYAHNASAIYCLLLTSLWCRLTLESPQPTVLWCAYACKVHAHTRSCKRERGAPCDQGSVLFQPSLDSYTNTSALTS